MSSISKILQNGSTLYLPNQFGAWILSTGCGSGKTTMYKDLIKEHWQEGILYTVDSRLECVSMYQWVMTNIEGIRESDIFMMFTKASDDKLQILAENNLNAYKQNPGMLLSKKVVIIPHPRLFCDIPGYFLVYNPGLTEFLGFDGDFKKLMTRDDLRQWILIDETPQFFKPFVEFQGWMIPLMKDKSETDISVIYQEWLKGKKYDPFKNSSLKLNQQKKDSALKMLKLYIPQWLIDEPRDSYRIQFGPKDLQQPGMKTHLYLAEGAGDVLFGGIKGYKLININPKYTSKLSLVPFKFSLNRKAIPGELEKQTFLNTLKEIIDNETQSVLVVVWKDFRGDNSIDDSEAANESQWRDEVKDGLQKLGVPESKFRITYYGASDCKSTNAYRECGSIVCCGKWMLPGSSVDKLNDGFGGMCDIGDYNLYQYIQLVSRIGLRNNTGDTYKMYYSEDFKDQKGNFPLGNRLLEYINNNNLLPIKPKVPGWVKKLQSIKNGKSQKDSIMALLGMGYLDEKMLEDNSNANQVKIKLADIAAIIPHSKKPRRDDYKFLIKTLGHLGISLIIE